MIKTAFLPSAGIGKRLRPMTERVPKPLLSVKGKPIIHHVMRHCAELGVERFIINTHHLHEAFEIAFPSLKWNGLAIELVHEPVRLETGSGLKNIEPLLHPNEPILVYNSDILTNLSLETLLNGHQSAGRPLVSLASSRNGKDLHLLTDKEGRLLKVDRSKEEGEGIRQQFLGISIIEPDFLRYLQKETPESLIHGWTRALAENPEAIRTCEMTKGRWQDIGTLASYESVRDTGLSRESLHLGLGNPTQTSRP